MRMPVGRCKYCGHVIDIDMTAGILVGIVKNAVIMHSCKPQAEAAGEFFRKQIQQGRICLDRRINVDPSEKDFDRNRLL